LAPAPDESIVTELRRLTLPATKALPFVKVRANDQLLWHPESFWYVEPTENRAKDIQLGRKYARLAIAAMKADHHNRLIALVIQDMIKDAIERSARNDGVSRGLAVRGFFAEISEIIAAAP
jgi:hypothetical protein